MNMEALMGAIDELSTRRLKHFPQRVGDTLFRRWRRDDMWSCSRLIYNILNVRLEDEQKVSPSMLSPIYKKQSEGFSSQIMHAGRESGLKSETKNHSRWAFILKQPENDHLTGIFESAGEVRLIFLFKDPLLIWLGGFTLDRFEQTL